MAVKLERFYKYVGGEWRCQLCEFTTPHRNRARSHAWSKHGIELEAEAVKVGYPARVLTPEENAVLVMVEPMVEIPLETLTPALSLEGRGSENDKEE